MYYVANEVYTELLKAFSLVSGAIYNFGIRMRLIINEPEIA